MGVPVDYEAVETTRPYYRSSYVFVSRADRNLDLVSIKDPRLIEAMGHFHPVPTQISGGELDEADDLRDAPPQFRGGPR